MREEIREKIEKGFFTMDTVKEALSKPTVDEAKQFARSLVFSAGNARVVNRNKALIAIEKATTTERLAITMTNFLMSHPSEGLAVAA